MSWTNYFAQNPLKIFLIDAFGAMFSAAGLALLIAPFEAVFGMPPQISYFLASLAGLFSVYSFVCYLQKPIRWHLFLRLIACFNLFYALLSAVLMFYVGLSFWGMAYFLSEILVLIVLFGVEIRLSFFGK